MYRVPRFLHTFAAVCSLSVAVVAQLPPPPPPIQANPNRIAAGKLENGMLNVQLEIVDGVWHAEAEDGPPLFVQAFREVGQTAQVPGPLFRVAENTTVHVTVTNKLLKPATVYGFVTRPATEDPGIEIAPNQTHEFTFASGAAGTYFYRARTTPKEPGPGGEGPFYEDAVLNGAFIVDPPGPLPNERIFVIGTMFGRPNQITLGFEVATINGKEYPFTDALEYTMGDTIRWRVINPSFSEHPMHLHGAFYKIVSLGDAEKDTQYAPGEQQSVVTEDVGPGQTMTMQWTPSHTGRWLFHCHFHAHMSSGERVPVFGLQKASLYGNPERVAGTPLPKDPEGAMHGMGGLMMIVNIKPKPGAPPEKVARNPRKLELVLQPDSPDGKSKLISCSIHEGSNVQTSHDRSVGPPLILHRDEPVEITIVNHLNAPTTINWHGLELDSYYDGVMGAGVGEQMTPMVAPGASFVVRFTPNRAGTFIYHTHSPNPEQLSHGVYGALIVLAPGQKYDAEHERLIVIGTRDTFFTAEHITVNGSETFAPIAMQSGVAYRLRIVNMAPNLPGTIVIGTKEHQGEWREVAKDGADVPPRLAKVSPSYLDIASGETYDFEYQPQMAGEIPITVINRVNGAKIEGKIIVEGGTAVASASTK
ncbi:MAG: multicopper oxidase domain-containing protein [Terriglobales bacterium]